MPITTEVKVPEGLGATFLAGQLRPPLAEPIFYSDGERGWFYDVSANNSTPAALHSVKGSPPLPPDPVGTFDFPDPSVTKHNGTYHAFGGNMVMSSLDLATWSRRSVTSGRRRSIGSVRGRKRW